MKKLYLLPLLLAAAPAPEPAKPVATPAPSPGEIVAAAWDRDWVTIAPSDLLVMDLAPDAKGRPRRVVIQLMPPPFSQGWIGNIRKLAAAKWWDGTSINRVQDNYVVQWGDASEKKPLPDGLVTVIEDAYGSNAAALRELRNAIVRERIAVQAIEDFQRVHPRAKPKDLAEVRRIALENYEDSTALYGFQPDYPDPYGSKVGVFLGWPITQSGSLVWPVHCYGMVGVGRNLSPDTGSGAELYTVIGHAPRHLDRNIALVGRVIEGIEHLSSLPRGTEALGFYKTAEERVPILSVRMGPEIKGLPAFQYLSTESAAFAKYANARANRRDPFFIKPAGGADICNIPVPVRRVK